MRVIGLDASTKTLAFCEYVDGKVQEFGEVTYSDSKNLFERLGSIEQRAGFLSSRYDDVDLVLIEAPVRVNNVRVVVGLAYSYGIVAAKFAARGMRVEDVPPITWQRYIGNTPLTKQQKDKLKLDNPNHTPAWYNNQGRKNRKQFTMDWVYKTYGVTVQNDNVADAIGIAHYGYHVRLG